MTSQIETQIQDHLARLGVGSAHGYEGLDLVTSDETPKGYVRLADTESIDLPAEAALAALASVGDRASDESERDVWGRTWEALTAAAAAEVDAPEAE